ncbi:MAG: hypothetical protein A4E60_03363 [Syntrophorhabdus sp. PtaB.Bin047]|jgi:hypothetical protein|nr:MAG: hypothetical protein A4E60_03363 [Syntrophorhabdus sp. PtaB.Bin047]
MSRTASSKPGKMNHRNLTQGEHKLEFAFSQDRTKYYYKTKSGVWCNIGDINPYGLRYILDRLEKEGHQSWEIYQIVSRELAAREAARSMRRTG